MCEKLSAKTPWKLAGNIPYYITGKLLRLMSDLEHKPERAVLMVQEEVAERICAEPPKMNRLAASVQFWADAKIVARVPKADFSPVPEVDSAVILLTTRARPQVLQAKKYYSAVRSIFAQPRKTILNNVKAGTAKQNLSKQEIEAMLDKIGIDPSARPQDLTVEGITSIAEVLF